MGGSRTASFTSFDLCFPAVQNVSSGASVVTCLVTPSDIVIGHAGDCRAVLHKGGIAVPLTNDHKASREDERERIEALGGHVDDFTGTWRVQGIMAVTRGLGDQHLKEYISPVPETRVLEACGDDDFIVLATDGLWDVVTSEEAVAVASAILFPTGCAAPADSESLALQLQNLLSPQVEANNNSPAAPLLKKGFRSSSLSGPGTSSSSPARAHCQSSRVETNSTEDDATIDPEQTEDAGSTEQSPVNKRLSKACKKLVELATTRGSYDDISVLIVLPSALRT